MTTDKIKRLFHVTAEDFKKIPGSPIGYWIGSKMLRCLDGKNPLDNSFSFREGIHTADNDRFLKLWFEISFIQIVFNAACYNDIDTRGKYVPYNKGGEFRKWYGNNEYVIGFNREKRDEMATLKGHVRPSQSLYFQEGGTWSSVSSGSFGIRYYPGGYLFDAGGQVAVGDDIHSCIAYLNSSLFSAISVITMPTINFKCGVIKTLPDLIIKSDIIRFSALSLEEISHNDWDSFETSWDFQNNPLIDAQKRCEEKAKIYSSYFQLREEWRKSCEEMRRLEVENNRIFIEAYGLQDELSPEVPWDEITLTCNPWYRYGKSPKADSRDGKEWLESTSDLPISDNWGLEHGGRIIVMPPVVKMKSCFMPFNQILEIRLLQDTIKELLSYAVGCMFGRYSLDVQGLAYAGGAWDASKYTTFPVDLDNIIPICDDEYFKDDLIGRFVKFIETVFGRESLEDNLNFIANALGGRGTAREIIRRYFRNDFFADHCKMYQKRPIYWLFDSGKKGGFRALIYMHRYQPSTLATLRTDYVHEQQERYRTAIADLAPRVDNASGSEKVKLSKQLAALREQAEETRIYEEKIHHLADQMISIDLDDGVKHNYAIFQDVLAKIK